jgi:LytS/YehU family sensor histidine kinase
VVLEDQRVILINELVSLDYDQNTLAFEFHGVTFRNPTSTQYFYRLIGLSNEWNSTNNTSVRFHHLNPGKYILELYALNRSGQPSETVSVPFRIRKHFTQTTLFAIGVILVAMIIVATIILYFYNAQRARTKLQREIYLSEQKAMLAQMNPHFIFNALNSIQDFILDSDEKNANAYLVLFSSLIRKVLEASNKNYISLSEEIEMVKLYLQLEKFRFEGKFDYKVHVSNGINPEQIMIPSMILQPYLENAIWHGLVPKNKDGFLELNIEKENSMGTVIKISDNGIGRERARQISRKRIQHTPMGMRNVEERIRLLNQLNRTNMSVSVIDLYGPGEEPAGTRVVLNIPGI